MEKIKRGDSFESAFLFNEPTGTLTFLEYLCVSYLSRVYIMRNDEKCMQMQVRKMLRLINCLKCIRRVKLVMNVIEKIYT